jgi:coenzyme PQQ precursor peptide PqqA
VGGSPLRLKSGSRLDDANPDQFWISERDTTVDTDPVAKCTERIGHFIFQLGYCVRGKNWIFFCQTIHGSEWAAGGIIMEWTAPSFEEVCLNCEINSYASAKL